MTEPQPELDPLKELEAQLKALQGDLNAAETNLAPLEQEYEEFAQAEAEILRRYEAEVNAIRAKKMTKNQALREAQRERERLENEARRIQEALEREQRRQKELEETAQALADEMAAKKALVERFDLLTQTAPWRKDANPHQITAGHKITQNRGVILADPMGLGKTLSAIITTEMAQQATKEADLDNPFLGEERKIKVNEHYVDNETGQKYFPGTYAFSNKAEEINLYPNRFTHVEEHYRTEIVNGITRPVGKRILYLCPNSLLRNVMEEWRLWTPHRSVTYVGQMTKKERNFLFDYLKNTPAVQEFVLVCNYEAWRRDNSMIEQLIELGFDTVIIDEAHNAKSQKTRVWWGINEILTNNRPEYVIPMTGTPILNRPQELYVLLNMVAPNKFYHENDFLFAYCEQDDDGNWMFKPGGLDRLATQIGDYFMRRTKEQAGIKLPPQTIIHHDLDLEPDIWNYPVRNLHQPRG
jgi:SNF2 family DNA or RNA helicase